MTERSLDEVEHDKSRDLSSSEFLAEFKAPQYS